MFIVKFEGDDKDSTAVTDDSGLYMAIAMIASGATPDLGDDDKSDN